MLNTYKNFGTTTDYIIILPGAHVAAIDIMVLLSSTSASLRLPRRPVFAARAPFAVQIACIGIMMGLPCISSMWWCVLCVHIHKLCVDMRVYVHASICVCMHECIRGAHVCAYVHACMHRS